jgi:TetR/AcrR family transcriptional regulator, regulator of cefoperazone and chloramphenicol sensitivity
MLARMGTPEQSDQTRRKLIEAAGRLFADRGFAGVGVRSIVAAAGVHLSAVNYQFRDKAGLYRACVAEAVAMPRFDAIDDAALVRAEPRDMLVKLVSLLMIDMRESGAEAWRSRLALRAIMDDDAETLDLIEELAAPKFRQLRAVLAAAGASDAGGEPDAVRVELALFSLVGSLEYVCDAPQIIDRLAPSIAKLRRHPARLAETLVDQAIAALRAPVTPSTPQEPRRRGVLRSREPG